jgi:hypothetical protein
MSRLEAGEKRQLTLLVKARPIEASAAEEQHLRQREGV